MKYIFYVFIENSINFKFKKIKFADLKEQLGHKPFEVIMGMLLGITLALLFEICIF